MLSETAKCAVWMTWCRLTRPLDGMARLLWPAARLKRMWETGIATALSCTVELLPTRPLFSRRSSQAELGRCLQRSLFLNRPACFSISLRRVPCATIRTEPQG
jgi:hypothetical protein